MCTVQPTILCTMLAADLCVDSGVVFTEYFSTDELFLFSRMLLFDRI